MSTNHRDAVHVETQFSVFLVNKPGVLARVCRRLAEHKVNMVAMTMMDSTEHGVLRLVTEDPSVTRTALSAIEVPTTETQVLAATMPNRPGALADLVQRLAAARIHVDYAYCTAGGTGGKTLGIFRVSDVKRAEKALAERRPQRKEPLGRMSPRPRK